MNMLLLDKWLKYLLHFDGYSTREFSATSKGIVPVRKFMPLPEFFEVWSMQFPYLSPTGLHLAGKFNTSIKNEFGQPTADGVIQFYQYLDAENKTLVNNWIMENVRL
jgi:hypothetical protein